MARKKRSGSQGKSAPDPLRQYVADAYVLSEQARRLVVEMRILSRSTGLGEDDVAEAEAAFSRTEAAMQRVIRATGEDEAREFHRGVEAAVSTVKEASQRINEAIAEEMTHLGEQAS